MKASLKIREGQKPLVRAKIPLNILGLPMLSGITAGDSKELCLHLGTFWDSGPALKLAYKPNDSWNPFSLVLKTGIGEWGSPAGAALAMTAEINLLGRGNPYFCLQFKPQLGDFTVKKSVRSSLPVPSKPAEDGGLFGSKPYFSPEGLTCGSTEAAPSKFQLKINGLDHDGIPGKGREENGDLENGTITPNQLENTGFTLTPGEEKSRRGQFSEGIGQNLKEFRFLGGEKSLEGLSLAAHSSFPVRKHAMVRVRWGLKMPFDLFKGWKAGDQSGFSMSKLPGLFMEKVSIENVEQMRNASKSRPYGGFETSLENLMLPIVREEANELAHITGICCSLRRQLHLLQAENSVLKKAMEDMRSELEFKGAKGFTENFSSLEASSWQRPHEEYGMKDKLRETNNKESDMKKGSAKESPRKDSKGPNGGMGNGFPTNTGSSAVDVSEELKKAIRGASGNLSDK